MRLPVGCLPVLSPRFGRPDMGLVSASEVAETVAILRDRVELPLIIDIDTGFGNALKLRAPCGIFERRRQCTATGRPGGAPSAAGHMAGKAVIPAGEMVGKLRAALDARADANTCSSPAPTRWQSTGSRMLERAERYLAAGADALFIEAPHHRRTDGHYRSSLRRPGTAGAQPGGGRQQPGAIRRRARATGLPPRPVSGRAVAPLHAVGAGVTGDVIRDTGSTESVRAQMCELADMNDVAGRD